VLISILTYCLIQTDCLSTKTAGRMSLCGLTVYLTIYWPLVKGVGSNSGQGAHPKLYFEIYHLLGWLTSVYIWMSKTIVVRWVQI